MKTILLAGGLGTRIREETHERPKPMVMIGNRPLLWHIMMIYAHYSHTDFIVCTGYLGDVIRNYFTNFRQFTGDAIVCTATGETKYLTSPLEGRLNVTIAQTGLLTSTAGRIRHAQKYLDNDDTFMVTYGDGLANINIEHLLKFHRTHGKLATMSVVQPEFRFGVVQFDDDNVAYKFDEKPRLSHWINAGFFVFSKSALKYMPSDDTPLEDGPLQQLAADRELMCYPHDGFFFAMDTFREYQSLCKMWDDGTAPWNVWK